ncbi:unnamed protein product [Cochlearia groenlandica]
MIREKPVTAVAMIEKEKKTSNPVAAPPAKRKGVVPAKPQSAPVGKVTSALVQAIENNPNILTGLVLKKVEAQFNKPKHTFGKPNALALAGPLGFSSVPIIKNWYEETEAEEHKKGKGRELSGSFARPNGPINFVGTRKGADLEPLAIEEIISPLKDLVDIPITMEDTSLSEKKKKGFTTALHARKKIVNTLARNGKMIKTSRLTMSDFNSVAKPRPSKAGPDKGNFSKTSKALVAEGPPAKG